jgi:mannitol/fructose-specific phosphotransferase system IIA component (Ntr-type)
MTLADFTRSGLIVLHLRGQDATSAIHELSLALQREGCVTDWLRFYNEALNREYLVSTEMEAGLALPHARLAGLSEPIFAFGRSDEPFAWGSREARFVRLVFLLAAPATGTGRYLPLVSSLARLAGNAPLLEAIRTATDEAGVLNVFRQMTLPDLPAEAPPAAKPPDPCGCAAAEADALGHPASAPHGQLLLQYCRLDTIVMVMIWRHWLGRAAPPA